MLLVHTLKAGLLVGVFGMTLWLMVSNMPSVRADYPLFEKTGVVGDQSVITNSIGLMTTDRDHNIYVIDNYLGTYCVKKLSPTGKYINQFCDIAASSGTSTGSLSDISGMAVDSLGNIFIVDADAGSVIKYTNQGQLLETFGSKGTGDGQFTSPGRIAIDNNDDLYLVDGGNGRVLKYSSNGTYLSQFGSIGVGDGQFTEPTGVAIDPTGRIYVTDTANYRIQVFDDQGSYIDQFVSYEPLLYGNRAGPEAITFDQAGNAYVSFGYHSKAAIYNPSFTEIGRITVTGRSNYGSDLAIGSIGELLFSKDYFIARYQTDGTALASIGSGHQNGQFRVGGAMTTDDAGNLYVIDTDESMITQSCTINKFSPDGDFLFRFGSCGSGDVNKFLSPNDIQVDSATGDIYVLDRRGPIKKFSSQGEYISQIGSNGSSTIDGRYYYPEDMSLDDDGNIYVADGTNRIQKFDKDGNFVAKATNSTPWSRLDVSSEGNIYLYKKGEDQILIYSPALELLQTINLDYPDRSQLTASNGFALDDNNNIYIGRSRSSPSSTDRQGVISVFDSDGNFLHQIEDADINGASLVDASAIAFDGDKMYANNMFKSYLNVYSITSMVTAPNSPQNVQIQPSNGSATITWQAPSGGSQVTGYKISFKPHDHVEWLKPVVIREGVSSFRVSNLLNGSYDFRITATNKAGSSSPVVINNQAIRYPYEFWKLITTDPDVAATSRQFAPDGSSYLTDSWTGQIVKLDPDGQRISSFAEYGSGVGALSCPVNSAIDSDGNLYVADECLDYVQKYASDGTYLGQLDSSPESSLSSATNIAIDTDGNIYAVDDYWRVVKFDSEGSYVSLFGAPEQTMPTAIATDKNGHVYVANYNEDDSIGIYKYTNSGTLISNYNFPYGEEEGAMCDITGLVVDPGTGNLVLSDQYCGRAIVLDKNGAIVNIIGSSYDETITVGAIDWPYDGYMEFGDLHRISFDPQGNMYMSYDPWDHKMLALRYTGEAIAPSSSAPAPPTSVTATISKSNKLNIAWFAPSDDGGSQITGYRVEYRSLDSTLWHTVSVASSQQHYTSDPLADGKYIVRVFAVNDVGLSSPAESDALAIRSSTVQPSNSDNGNLAVGISKDELLVKMNQPPQTLTGVDRANVARTKAIDDREEALHSGNSSGRSDVTNSEVKPPKDTDSNNYVTTDRVVVSLIVLIVVTVLFFAARHVIKRSR